MAKKFKKCKKDTAHRTPPLSGLDKAIYIGISVLLFVSYFGLVLGCILLQDRIAFHDPDVIASRGRLSNYAVLPLYMFVFIFGICILSAWFGGKKPIFGKKSIRYGEYPWKTDLFPLFGPQHREVRRSASELRFRAKMTRILSGIFIALLLLACLGIFGRVCLREDRTIVVYNSLNHSDEPVSIARDCDRIVIKAGIEYHARGGPTWHYGFIFHGVDGREYEFMDNDFNLGHSDCLRQLLAIKALFSADQITIEREDLLPKVIEDNDLDEVQTALLYQLFEPPQ